MFNVALNGPNRVDIEYSGKLDADDKERALDDLLRLGKDMHNGRLLYRIGDFALPTLGAFRVEFSRIPKLFKLIKNFDRAAVLTEKKWVRTVSEIEGALIPGLKIKAFTLDQEAEAEAWLAE